MPDEDIDYSDIPNLGEEFWANAVLRTPPVKQPISLRLDQHVLDYFKAQGKGYQTLINSVLRSYVETQQRAFRVRRTKFRALSESETLDRTAFKKSARKRVARSKAKPRTPGRKRSA